MRSEEELVCDLKAALRDRGRGEAAAMQREVGERAVTNRQLALIIAKLILSDSSGAESERTVVARGATSAAQRRARRRRRLQGILGERSPVDAESSATRRQAVRSEPNMTGIS